MPEVLLLHAPQAAAILPSVFGLGSLEILLILALGLVVLGPRRLPEVARQLGRFYGQIRRTTHELRSTLDQEIREEERTVRREKAVARREELETVRRERASEAQERLKNEPEAPTVSSPVASDSPNEPSEKAEAEPAPTVSTAQDDDAASSEMESASEGEDSP